MIKNETKTTKTRTAKATSSSVKETVTEPVQPTRDFGYYSKVLNKPFNSLAELIDAEEAHAAELRAKEDAVSVKKALAAEVKETIKCRLEAEIVARDTKAEAYKEYLAKCEEADRLVEDRKKEEADILTTWNKEYGAFRDEITVGDTNYYVSYKVDSDITPPSAVDLFEKVFNYRPTLRLF